MPNRPDWPIVEESVPLGTVYEVMGYHREAVIFNSELNEAMFTDTYFLVGNGSAGWMPTICFEVTKHEKQSS